MHASKLTETQIVATLKQADAGAPVKDSCRQRGISTATYFASTEASGPRIRSSGGRTPNSRSTTRPEPERVRRTLQPHLP